MTKKLKRNLLLHVSRARRILVQHANHVSGAIRHGYFRIYENIGGFDFAAVQVLVHFTVLVHASAFKGDVCEASARARVGVDLGMQRNACPGRGGAPKRSSGHRSIATQRELIRQQLLSSTLMDKQEDHIDGLRTNVEARVPACNFEGGDRAPRAFHTAAAGDKAVSETAAEAKRSFLQRRNHGK